MREPFIRKTAEVKGKWFASREGILSAEAPANDISMLLKDLKQALIVEHSTDEQKSDRVILTFKGN